MLLALPFQALGNNEIQTRHELDTEWASGQYETQGLYFTGVPDWVSAIKIPTVSEIPKDEVTDGIYTLLVDNQYRVPKEDAPEYYSRYAKQITGSDGLETASQIEIEFDPSYEKILFHGVRLKRDGVWLDKSRDVSFSLQDSRGNDALLVRQNKSAYWIVNDVRVGDIFEYHFTRIGQNPVYQGIFSAARTLQWSVPVHDQHYRLVWQKETPPNIHFTDGEMEMEQIRLGDTTEYKLMLNQVPAVRVPNDTPSWYRPYARVFINEVNSWQEVTDWARPLFERQTVADDEITALAKRFKESGDQKQQVAAATQFVQEEIRYLGLEMGSNSHMPASAPDTLTKRYGDCKDKTVLLAAILRAMGVKASPVLVHSTEGQVLDTMQPSPKRFNHAIVKAEVAGEVQWIDPTILHQQATGYQPDYGYALVLDDTGHQLELMSKSNSGSRVEYKEVYKLPDTNENPLSLRVVTTYGGVDAINGRSTLSSNGLEGVSEQYLKYYGNSFPTITIAEPLEVVHGNHGELTYHESYNMDEAWEIDEAGALTIYFSENQVSSYLQVPDAGDPRPRGQTFPLEINGLIRIELESEDWSFTDERINESNPFFDYQYQLTFDKKGRKLMLEYSFKTHTDLISAEELKAYSDAILKVRDSLSIGLTRSAPASATSSDSQAVPDNIGLSEAVWIVIILVIMLFSLVLAISSFLVAKDYDGEVEYYPVSPISFYLLSLVTLGIYPFYWQYKCWQYIKRRDDSDIWPFVRALFGVFWLYPLYLTLKQRHSDRNISFPVSTFVMGVLCFLFFVFNASHQLSEKAGWFSELLLPLCVLPLVLYVNQLNLGRREAIAHNSRPRARHIAIAIVTVPLAVFAVTQSIGLMPSERVVKGDELWQRDISYMQRKQLFGANETPVLFYSDALFNVRDDGNGFTDTRVFSYWKDEGQFDSRSVPFEQVAEIEIEYADSDNDNSVITITLEDQSYFLLFVPHAEEDDQRFYQQLNKSWQSSKT
ncbi:DUF3857 domain-containing protein [Shewanella corallii]|uniref:DUF3857 domain-containing protein n=1 Tax=Shewanella corallii TaxID=560080 RepID=A0ABT0NCJ3_9GAMM|nr:DUF3857 domain-containing protein [Shewanella corallii]MCL2916082.1 DUF3857 domain-containing protein [Shewanella corallii]